MKINKTNELIENSEKKIVNNFSLLKIILNEYILFLPILLFLGIELQKHIMEVNLYLLYNTLYFPLLFDYIISLLVLLFFLITVFYYQRFNYKKRIIKQDLRCIFCKNKAIIELYRIPNFFIDFGIPLCEQHAKLLNENPNELLYNEQKLYKKCNSIIIWLNILIIVSGVISLYSFGLIFGVNGNISLIISIFILFTIQVALYFYLYVRMFIKIRSGIENLKI